MTILVVILLVALIVLALLPVLLLNEVRVWRVRRSYEQYRREIPITRTTGATVDLTGAKPTTKRAG